METGRDVEMLKEERLIEIDVGLYGTIVAIMLLSSGNGVTNCA